jgi:Transcriptional regulator
MSDKSTIIKPRPIRRDREAQKRETERRILDAAVRVFGRDGIAAATTEAIAIEAGVSHGSIFARFGTQEDLLATTIEDFGRAAATRMHEALSSSSSLRAVLEAHLASIGAEEDFYARLVSECGSLPRAARDSLALMQSSVAFHLAPAVEAGQKAGRIKKASLPLLFNTWLGLVHYYLANRELFSPGSSLVDERGKELVDHYMSLIAK